MVKFLTWNMEWMNDLFGSNYSFRQDDEKTQHMRSATVLDRRRHLSKVINELSPDVIVIVEGPNVTEELQLFFDTDVVGNWQCHIQRSPGMTQCIGLAVRIDTGKFAAEPFTAFDTLGMPAFQEWHADLDDDGVTEVFKFERSPLYAWVNLVNGKSFAVLGLHLKSKLVASALEWSRWWERADANRKKILSQAQRVRTAFVDAYLRDNLTAGIPLLVTGDINDGPGMDTSERKLLGSGMEKLMGNIWFPELALGNALFDTLSENDKNRLRFDRIATTSFADPIFNSTYHRVWIDHIMYSRNKSSWVSDAKVHERLSEGTIRSSAYKYSSDHFPISCTITL